MPIDRIGKGSTSPVGPKDVTGVEGAAGAERAFQVRPEPTAAPTKAAPVQTVAPTPLERLRAGEIDVDGYVELRVEEATVHLKGLPTPELESIRATLRARVASDPTLVDLVRHATGGTPTRVKEGG